MSQILTTATSLRAARRPSTTMGRAARRRVGDRGAVLVELAMVVPVLILLIMGIVDYAVLFNQKIGLRGGVREASWNGGRAIFGAAPDAACHLTFSGIVPDTNTQKIMCMAKRRSGLDPSELRVMVRFVNMDNPALPATYGVGNGIMVCAMRKASSTTHFFSTLLSNKYQVSRLTTVILSEMLVIPLGGAETSFPGNAAGWSFCDPTKPPPD